MSEGGTALVYLTVPDPEGQLLARAKAALTGLEGIDTIVEPPTTRHTGCRRPPRAIRWARCC